MTPTQLAEGPLASPRAASTLASDAPASLELPPLPPVACPPAPPLPALLLPAPPPLELLVALALLPPAPPTPEDPLPAAVAAVEPAAPVALVAAVVLATLDPAAPDELDAPEVLDVEPADVVADRLPSSERLPHPKDSAHKRADPTSGKRDVSTHAVYRVLPLFAPVYDLILGAIEISSLEF